VALLPPRYSLFPSKQARRRDSRGPARKTKWGCDYALKLLPQPQPPVALGLEKVKPDPCIEVT
jgi:hypothetical protein